MAIIANDLINYKDRFTHIVGDGTYSVIFFSDGTRQMSALTLKVWEGRLNEGNWVRVHKKYLINLNFIKGYQNVGPKIVSISVCGKVVSISRRKQTAHLNALIKQARMK